MAYSIQLYKFRTSKTPQEVQTILLKNKKPSNVLEIKQPKIKNGLNIFALTITDTHEKFYYEITLDTKSRLLIIQGTGIKRRTVLNHLVKIIEDAKTIDVVDIYALEPKQSMALFKEIVAQDFSNIISMLVLKFDAKEGKEFKKEIYTELAYRFKENRCASKHIDFKEIKKDANKLIMIMQIVECAGITDSKSGSKSIRLDIRPNCSFRVYSNIPQSDWNNFCFTVLRNADIL